MSVITPADFFNNLTNSASSRLSASPKKILVSAALAGASIGFGALFFLVMMSDPQLSLAPKRLLGGISFCLGLILVVLLGTELFTGCMLLFAARLRKGISTRKMLRHWILVWLGNLIGALVLAGLILVAATLDLGQGKLASVVISTAQAKCGLSVPEMFVRGILCNVLVCLAVVLAATAESTQGKILGVIFPISAFVVLGFEHSVANMLFLPLALGYQTLADAGFVSASSELVAQFASNPVTFSATAINIASVTLGNIVGGAFVVALPLHVITQIKPS